MKALFLVTKRFVVSMLMGAILVGCGAVMGCGQSSSSAQKAPLDAAAVQKASKEGKDMHMREMQSGMPQKKR